MTNMMKRCLRLLVMFILILAVFPKDQADASTLSRLQAKFPNGAYWNHVAGSGHYYSNYSDQGSCNNPDGYSWSPCYSHNADAPYGCYDCNSFNGGLQCCGFARKLAYDAYGSYSTNWTNYTYSAASNYMWNSLKPGDVLHYTGGNAGAGTGHWVFVTAVNGNAITVGECNLYNAPCQIRWGNVIYKGDINPVRVCVAPYALDNSSGSDTPVSLITWTDSQAVPRESDAYLYIQANAPYSGSWGSVGITVCDASNKVVAQKNETAASNATNYLKMWYNLTEETGAVLAPNTTYFYQFYVYFNGVGYTSDVLKFTTQPCSTHTIVNVAAVPAGCTTSGKTAGKKCSVCGIVTEGLQTIASKGHVYSNSQDTTCNTCGAKRQVATTLAAPSAKISNVSSTGKIKVSWNKVSGATKYEVYRATSKSGSYTKLTTTSKTSVTNNSTTTGKTYYYKVRAVGASGNKSKFSSVVSRICKLGSPEVTISNVASSGKVKLSWDKISGASKYEVWRATSQNGTYTKLTTTTKTSVTDSKATAGKTYYYKVKAIYSNSSANSAYSEIVSKTCDLPRPDVTVKKSSGNVKVSWNKISGTTQYEVYRATSKNGTYKRIKSTTSTSYTDKSVKSGKTYYYKVKAIHSKSGANSAYSTVDSIKVK